MWKATPSHTHFTKLVEQNRALIVPEEASLTLVSEVMSSGKKPKAFFITLLALPVLLYVSLFICPHPLNLSQFICFTFSFLLF